MGTSEYQEEPENARVWKDQGMGGTQKPFCGYCGILSNSRDSPEVREKECYIFSEFCNSYGKIGHCRAKFQSLLPVWKEVVDMKGYPSDSSVAS